MAPSERILPPSPFLFALEGRAWLEFAALVPALPLLARAPRGDGHPVLVLPGWLMSDRSTWALRRFLRDRDYHVHGWRLGLNLGPDARTVTGLGQRFVALRARHRRKVSLIGSSLGGYLAALYASRHAEVEKLVLLAPAFGFARRWAEMEDTTAWRRTGYKEVYHYGQGRMCRLSYQLMEDALRYEDFPSFTQPALVFHGTLDDVVPAKFSQEFAATHVSAQLHLLNSDHELLDALDEIWRKTEPFLLG